MAFIDKLNAIAKNVGEKTGDAIEITKLNAKISGEKSALNELYKQLGENIYAKYRAGVFQNEDLAGFFASADTCMANIAEAESKIAAIKAANEAKGQEMPDEQEAAPVEVTCPSCGAVSAGGVKFCTKCGTRLEAPAIEAETKKVCAACGTEAAPGACFCCNCGAKIE